jgi:hypothetical protein
MAIITQEQLAQLTETLSKAEAILDYFREDDFLSGNNGCLQALKHSQDLLQSLKQTDDNFVWERAITLTPDEVRVLRVVSKEYGMRMQRYYNDGAIAVRLGSNYDLIHYWDNPYANTTHFGLTKYGRELFGNKRFLAYCEALDEKETAQPEMVQAKQPPSLNLTVNKRLLKNK